MNITWNDGVDNYKKHTHKIDCITKIHYFNTELLNVSFQKYNSVHEYCEEVFQRKRSKTVNVLYSGGLDSELVLYLCMIHKIPVTALTMRLLINGYPINTHDLYYSEKFCRENNVRQVILDLDVEAFFNNGEHIKYLKPYLITEPHVSTHFWLFEQSDNFPVLGGEYSWPWVHKNLLSPHRHHYCYYDKFLCDNNIDGIGNFLNYSLSGNLFFIENHLSLLRSVPIETNAKFIPIFKKLLWSKLNLASPTPRLRSYGWENLSPAIFDLQYYRSGLEREFGITHSSITWGSKVNEIIGGTITTNDKYR